MQHRPPRAHLAPTLLEHRHRRARDHPIADPDPALDAPAALAQLDRARRLSEGGDDVAVEFRGLGLGPVDQVVQGAGAGELVDGGEVGFLASWFLAQGRKRE